MNQPASKNGEKAGLKWTGHPLVDVGVATLCVMAGKMAYPTRPQQAERRIIRAETPRDLIG